MTLAPVDSAVGYSVLDNPLTPAYEEWKRAVLSEGFPWWYAENGTSFHADETDENLPLFSHGVLDSPEHRANLDRFKNGHSAQKPPSSYLPETWHVVDEILDYNGFAPRVYYRMAINLTGFSNVKITGSHVDHHFPHQIMLVYLTDFEGGNTWFDGVRGPTPQSDMALTFNGGDHWHESTTQVDARRIVLNTSFTEHP